MPQLAHVRALLTAVLFLALPAVATAQDAPADHTHAPGDPAHAHDDAGDLDEINAWLTEIDQVHRQLEGLQNQALQDPDLVAVQESLGEEIRLAMVAIDPMLDQQIERIGELQAEASSAQQSGDTQGLQELITEAQQIQQRYMEVQQQVLEQPAISGKVTDFQSRIESKMLEIDPGARTLIDRMRELETLLNEAIG